MKMDSADSAQPTPMNIHAMHCGQTLSASIPSALINMPIALKAMLAKPIYSGRTSCTNSFNLHSLPFWMPLELPLRIDAFQALHHQIADDLRI